MRFARVGVSVAILLMGTMAGADVRLATKNGRKVITNFGFAGGAKAGNLNWLAKRHDRRSKYDPIIEKYASRYGVDPVLVRAVIQVESDFNPGRISHKGARGLMQLIPATAKRYGVTSIHDPDQNIRGGVKYLADLLNMFDGDLSRVLAGYNAGENAVRRYGGIPPYDETQNYVVRALTVYYGRPYGGGATMFAGKRGGPKLRGGFAAPVAAAMIPGAKILGTR